MSQQDINKEEILEAAKAWFRKVIVKKHIKNTKKITNPSELTINPFLIGYLSKFLSGKSDAVSIAKALVYPRVLGTSITTSFGQNLQKFISEVLGSVGSTTLGIDIEFFDQIDGQQKYCQLKAGPNNINSDSVENIHGKFKNIKNLARTNNKNLNTNSMIIGVLYGERHQLSGHFARGLEGKHDHPVFIGKEFWVRLTGDEDFYFDLIEAIASIASEVDGTKLLQDTIDELANTDIVKRLAESIN